MLLMNPIRGKDAATAAEYFVQSDGGYYLDGKELRREWGGKAIPLLGLAGRPECEQLDRLLHGRHPLTGEQLTARMAEDRLSGWDFTARLPKHVTAAIERGDERIMPVVWQALHDTLAEIEDMGTTRVRKDGQYGDRKTGNIAWVAVEHPEARPVEDKSLPEDHPWRVMSDWDRHIHGLVLNQTWDDDEKKWKALKVREIFKLRKFFSHRFDLRVSAALADLGYELVTERKPDAKRGGMEYHTWDIKAAPGFEAEMQSGKVKMSRRHQEIEQTAKEIVAARKERDPDAPDEMSPGEDYRLGRTTRRGKLKGDQAVTLDGLREYWDWRLTPEEKGAYAVTIGRAREGLNPRPKSKAAAAMAYAIEHEFFTKSVVDYDKLLITAMEKCMGGARPEDLDAEAKRQGVMRKDGKASTQAVLDQERRIIGFARAGKGTCRPLAPERDDGLAGLSEEQAAAVRHVWQSKDRVMLIRGGAGTGKTTMMTPALARLGVPAVLLAPSSDASRGQLRDEGLKDANAPAAFKEANTVASFLGDKKMQEKARGGIVWVDEASLLAIDDLDKLCGMAKELDARIVLQGDPKQHKAVQRHGNMLTVLEDYAGLKVAKLTKIQRQKGDYAKAVAAIRDGKVKQGDAALRKLGWVVEGDGHDALVAEYAGLIGQRKANGEEKTILVIDPTHKDGDALSEKLRAVRREKGLVVGDERAFPQLVALGWTPAQQGDAGQYAGDEVIQFFRKSGRFKAGQRVAAAELLPELASVNPACFAVYRAGEVRLAVGDKIRVTANGRDVTGEHRLDNGRIDTIRGFTPKGDMVLANGWVMAKDFAHLKHGLVSTSPASQSKTHDVVLGQFNQASLAAMSAEQWYVTISRGRECGMMFTDMAREELLAAVARADSRMSATELFHKKPKAAVLAKSAERVRSFMEKVRHTYRQIQRKAASVAASLPAAVKEPPARKDDFLQKILSKPLAEEPVHER
jgi:conjugative relaxase-like TrwC/TraI family protein